jgi:integrase/recombinase XerD
METKDNLDDWAAIPELSIFMGGVKGSTRRKYKDAIYKYELYTGMSAKELVDEAEAERKKPRREQGAVKRRLQGFHKWLTTEWVQRDRWGNPKKDKKGNPIIGLGAFKANMVVGNIKSFYSANGFPVRWNPPKAAPKKQNERIEYSPKMVRRLLSALKSNRDRSIVLTGYQGGFDSDTVSKLNLADLPKGFLAELEKATGDIEEALERIRPPILLHVVREKEGIDYHTCLGSDATKALLVYLWERIQAEEDLTPEKPLYTITEYNGARTNPERRIRPNHIHKFMREAVVRAGIVDEKTLEHADLNPAGFHALRASFSRRLEYAGMPVAYFEYMQGHSLPHGGAYRKPNPKRLLDKYREFGHVLEVSETPLTYREVEENLKKELEKRDYLIKGMEKRIKELETKVEALAKLGEMETELRKLVETVRAG